MRTALLQISGGLLLAALAGRVGARLAERTAVEPPAARTAAPLPAATAAPLPAATTAAPLPAATMTTAQAVPPAVPAPTAALPARPEPIASYTLRATLDPVQHVVQGEGTLRWKNASRVPQRELYVHLYLNGFKTKRTLFLRTPVGGFRGDEDLSAFGRIDVKRFVIREMDSGARGAAGVSGGAPEGADVWPAGRPTTPGDPDDETDIRVELPRPVEPGETITVDLAWESHLPSISLRTGYYGTFHMVGQWFPKVARIEPDGRWAHFPFHRLSEFYADFGTYDVTVDVPEGFEVGATGRLEREDRAGGRVVRRFVQEDVHDFAFTAWDGFRERRAVTEGGIAIRCLFPPGNERAAEDEIAAARFGLARFGAQFGPYPYSTLTIVHPPRGAEEAGGMEYPTLITTGGAWYLPYTGVRFLEDLTFHELAHEWFYGLVATNENRYPFLDEGLTSYAELGAMRATSASSALGARLDLGALQRVGALIASHNAPIAQPAPEFLSGSDYGALVYGRTSALLATLAGVYGEDALHHALGRYARDNRFQHPGPDALLAAVRETLGEEAAEALRVGLFERGWVDYVVSSVESRAAAAEAAPASPDAAPSPTASSAAPADGSPQPPERAAFEGSVLVRRRGTLVFPVDIELHTEDGTAWRVRWDARATTARIPYAGPTRLVGAVIDPDHRVLLDEDLTNNARRHQGVPLAPRVLDWASFAAGVALWAIAP